MSKHILLKSCNSLRESHILAKYYHHVMNNFIYKDSFSINIELVKCYKGSLNT